MSYTQTATARPARSVEEGLNVALNNAQQCVRTKIEECEESVRQSPATALVAAAAAGYCLHHLPVRAIVVAHVRLLAALVPPALFLFGAAKVYEFLQNEAESAPASKK